MLFYYSFVIFHSLYFRNSEYHVSILKNLTKLSLLFKVCFYLYLYLYAYTVDTTVDAYAVDTTDCCA